MMEKGKGLKFLEGRGRGKRQGGQGARDYPYFIGLRKNKIKNLGLLYY
jgi:hypothetical protein